MIKTEINRDWGGHERLRTIFKCPQETNTLIAEENKIDYAVYADAWRAEDKKVVPLTRIAFHKLFYSFFRRIGAPRKKNIIRNSGTRQMLMEEREKMKTETASLSHNPKGVGHFHCRRFFSLQFIFSFHCHHCRVVFRAVVTEIYMHNN